MKKTRKSKGWKRTCQSWDRSIWSMLRTKMRNWSTWPTGLKFYLTTKYKSWDLCRKQAQSDFQCKLKDWKVCWNSRTMKSTSWFLKRMSCGSLSSSKRLPWWSKYLYWEKNCTSAKGSLSLSFTTWSKGLLLCTKLTPSRWTRTFKKLT